MKCWKKTPQAGWKVRNSSKVVNFLKIFKFTIFELHQEPDPGSRKGAVMATAAFRGCGTQDILYNGREKDEMSGGDGDAEQWEGKDGGKLA